MTAVVARRFLMAGVAAALGLFGASGCFERDHDVITITLAEETVDEETGLTTAFQNRFEWRLVDIDFDDFLGTLGMRTEEERADPRAAFEKQKRDILGFFQTLAPVAEASVALEIDGDDRGTLVYSGTFGLPGPVLGPLLMALDADKPFLSFFSRDREYFILSEALRPGEAWKEPPPVLEPKPFDLAAHLQASRARGDKDGYLVWELAVRMKAPEKLHLRTNAPYRDAEGYACWLYSEVSTPGGALSFSYGDEAAP